MSSGVFTRRRASSLPPCPHSHTGPSPKSATAQPSVATSMPSLGSSHQVALHVLFQAGALLDSPLHPWEPLSCPWSHCAVLGWLLTVPHWQWTIVSPVPCRVLQKVLGRHTRKRARAGSGGLITRRDCWAAWRRQDAWPEHLCRRKGTSCRVVGKEYRRGDGGRGYLM
jgi:hypothetical protein